MADLPIEIIEQILIRSDVKDLIRYRTVSESWNSLISTPDFIKSHLDQSYRCESENDKIGSRRIVMCCIPCCKYDHVFEVDGAFFPFHNHHLLGSSNGLVCISPSRYGFLVLNPETREVKKLKKPQIPEKGSLYYGFGSCKDNYMVILGFEPVKGITCFQMFSLKSQTWAIIEEVNYSCISRTGILTNGALHWVAYRDDSIKKEQVILSFDLSDNKFREIPHPDDDALAKDGSMRLGIMDDCLCAFRRNLFPNNIWVMNQYNVKESWELVEPERKINIKIVNRLKELKYYVPNKRSLCHSDWFIGGPEFLGAPRFIPSLVSPHVCKKLERKSYKRGRAPPCLMLCPTDSSDAENYEREM